MDNVDSLMLSKPIVIEGADGSGKSTLIKQCFPGAIHMGGPPKTPEELRERLYLPRPGCVYDRWTAISEQVYGDALRDKPLIRQNEFDRAISEIQPIVIYCKIDLQNRLYNLRKQTVKEHKSEEFIEQIIKNAPIIDAFYDQVITRLPRLGCTVFTYDFINQGVIQK